jgi:hypothetical protein
MEKKYTKIRPLFTRGHWVPLLGAIVLLAMGVFGLLRLYKLGPEACASLTYAERRTMSLAVDPTIEDFDHNFVERPVSLFGRVVTADTKAIFDAVNLEKLGDSYASMGSLLGTYQAIEAEGTKYILNCYRDTIFPTVTWNSMSGVEESNGSVNLTIDTRLQNAVYEAMVERGVIGSITMMDYETGDLLALCSTPGWGSDGDGSYINRALYPTVPGSTQKLVTSVVLERLTDDAASRRFTCHGAYTLPNGQVIHCTGVHGENDLAGAIGKSCNAWFAQAVLELDIEEAKTALSLLGVGVNETPRLQLGNIPIDGSSVTLGDEWQFNSLWCLIGQDKAMVSPIKMCELLGTLATEGRGVRARLTLDAPVETIPYDDEMMAAFSRTYADWQEGYERCYDKNLYGPYITAAKTGTADGLPGNVTHKLLACVSDTQHIAMYIVVENYADCRVNPADLAREALETTAELRK